MKKSLIAILSTILFGTLFLNAQPLNEDILKQMKKDAKGAYVEREEGENGDVSKTGEYFNKEGMKIGTVYDSTSIRRIAYGVNKTDSTIVYFDSLGIVSSVDYKTPKKPTPSDTTKYNVAPVDSSQYGKLGEIFSPVIRGE